MSNPSQIQKQISQLQSKLAKSRSNTPRRESMNSKQRRKSKSPARKKGPRPQDRAILKYKQVEDHDDQYKMHGGAKLDYKRARTPLQMFTVNQMISKIKTAHQRAESLKLPVWDHTKRVITDNGKTRFQTFAEWKATLPKPSLLTEALKSKKCDHHWRTDLKTGARDACYMCGISFVSLKDEKDDVLADTYKELYESVCSEFEVARNVLRAGLKNKPIKMTLTGSFIVGTTVTTGVTNTVTFAGSSQAVQQSDGNEWSSLRAIFDETKMNAGRIEFLYNNGVVVSGTTGVSMSPNSTPIIAYDPAEIASTATGTSTAANIAQHMMFSPLIVAGNTLSTSQVFACPANGIKHTFKFHVPPGDTEQNASQGAVIGHQWQSTEGSILPVGSVVFYHVGTCITATNTGAGTIFYECEFRCRE